MIDGLSLTSARVPWLLAGLSLVAGIVLNLVAPWPYLGLPLLAAAPLVAGAMLSFRAATSVACVTCAVTVGMDIYHGREAVALYVDLAVVGVIGALALAVNRLIARQGQNLAMARNVAEAVQRAVLPDPPTGVGPLAVAAGYTAAQAEARIGGDLFAVQDTPYGVRMIIGDVRGKGVQAVAAVSVAIGAFRKEAEYTPTLDELAQRLDDALASEADQTAEEMPGEDFTTALLAEVSPDGEVLTLLNRGHPAPYLVHRGSWYDSTPRSRSCPWGWTLAQWPQMVIAPRSTRCLCPRRFAAADHRRHHRGPGPVRHVLRPGPIATEGQAVRGPGISCRCADRGRQPVDRGRPSGRHGHPGRDPAAAGSPDA